jgi:hypothetical protein
MSLLRLITFRQQATEDEYRVVPTNGLMLYYDFTNSNCYSGTGSTVNDLSGNSYNGTLVNSPVYSSTDGGELLFNPATNTHINIDAGLSTNFGSKQITIFSVFTNNAVVSKPGALSFTNSASPGGLANFNAFYPGNRLTNNQTIQQLWWPGWKGGTKTDHVLDTWYTGVWAVNNTNISFYIDNVSNGGGTVSSFSPTSNTITRIGYANGVESHSGKIQVMIVYNRILTTQELTDLHNTFAI